MRKFVANASAALCALGFSVVLTAPVQAATAEEIMIERIKPVGKVCLQGDDSCGAASAAPAGGARSGADIVSASCNACHASGVLGAPKIGTGEWAARLDEKGFDMLLANAINGINSMPPRGTCATCSDDDIKAAIEHMLEASQ